MKCSERDAKLRDLENKLGHVEAAIAWSEAEMGELHDKHAALVEERGEIEVEITELSEMECEEDE